MYICTYPMACTYPAQLFALHVSCLLRRIARKSRARHLCLWLPTLLRRSTQSFLLSLSNWNDWAYLRSNRLAVLASFSYLALVLTMNIHIHMHVHLFLWNADQMLMLCARIWQRHKCLKVDTNRFRSILNLNYIDFLWIYILFICMLA